MVLTPLLAYTYHARRVFTCAISTAVRSHTHKWLSFWDFFPSGRFLTTVWGLFFPIRLLFTLGAICELRALSADRYSIFLPSHTLCKASLGQFSLKSAIQIRFHWIDYLYKRLVYYNLCAHWLNSILLLYEDTTEMNRKRWFVVLYTSTTSQHTIKNNDLKLSQTNLLKQAPKEW